MVILLNHDYINSLWPSDHVWRHKSGATLAQVMACCLTATSHYLNQCWLGSLASIPVQCHSKCTRWFFFIICMLLPGDNELIKTLPCSNILLNPWSNVHIVKWSGWNIVQLCYGFVTFDLKIISVYPLLVIPFQVSNIWLKHTLECTIIRMFLHRLTGLLQTQKASSNGKMKWVKKNSNAAIQVYKMTVLGRKHFPFPR